MEKLNGTIKPGYATAAYGAQEVEWRPNSGYVRRGDKPELSVIYDRTMLYKPGAEFKPGALAATFEHGTGGFGDGTLFKREVGRVWRVFMTYTARNDLRYEQRLIEVPERDDGQPLIEYAPYGRGNACFKKNTLPQVRGTNRIEVMSLVRIRELVALARDIIGLQRVPTDTEARRLKLFVGGMDDLQVYHSKLDYFIQCVGGL